MIRCKQHNSSGCVTWAVDKLLHHHQLRLLTTAREIMLLLLPLICCCFCCGAKRLSALVTPSLDHSQRNLNLQSASTSLRSQQRTSQRTKGVLRSTLYQQADITVFKCLQSIRLTYGKKLTREIHNTGRTASTQHHHALIHTLVPYLYGRMRR